MKDVIGLDQQEIIDAIGHYVEHKLNRKCAGPVQITPIWETVDGQHTGRQVMTAYVEVEPVSESFKPKFEGSVPRD